MEPMARHRQDQHLQHLAISVSVAVSCSTHLLAGGAYVKFSLLLSSKAQDIITLNLPSVSPPTAIAALIMHSHWWCAVNK